MLQKKDGKCIINVQLSININQNCLKVHLICIPFYRTEVKEMVKGYRKGEKSIKRCNT